MRRKFLDVILYKIITCTGVHFKTHVGRAVVLNSPVMDWRAYMVAVIIFLNEYATPRALRKGLNRYIEP
jgi:hypothetical protein